MTRATENSVKPFKRVLIANRGEIAVRIIRALRDLGIQSVAIYSDADNASLHRGLADYAVRLPGRTSAETYLNIPLVIDAIKRSGADGVHPGYGFLSENNDFAKAVIGAGVTFIGPSPDAMHKMGDKVEAKKIMQAADVPTVPGSDGELHSVAELKTLVKKIGYPIIIKAAAGGGGRGMRVIREDKDIEPAYAACAREAQSYFGNPAIFCERYIEKGRHIEVQVMFDGHGNGVHLFERDCSIQRRHQKLIEEAPSTFLDPAARKRLGEIAVKAGLAVKYQGAGTVEFICEAVDRCYFMEMNTRIQVEHPVTEMITGMDLIREQIRVAQGERLSVKQDDIRLDGWSFEVRINAEDPTKGFLPGPGLVRDVRFPAGPGVRVDSHLYSGYVIPEEYDSMVAKIIVWGKTRDEARSRMLRALSEFRIDGVPTTARFHEAVLNEKDFAEGRFFTRYLEEKMDGLQKRMLGSAGNEHGHEIAAFAAFSLAERKQRTEGLTSGATGTSAWTKKATEEQILS